MLPRVRFYFMRHGQTDWNADGRIMGQQQVPLNAQGIEQAEQARIIIDTLAVQKVVYSPLLRAQQTMEIATVDLHCPKIACPELMERAWGVWEGRLKSELGLGSGVTSMMLRPETPPGAETRDQFFVRVLRGMNSILTSANPCLIVAHSGVYRILCHAIGLDENKVSIGNCQVVQFEPLLTDKRWDITLL